jgi:hypothetical protein
MATAAEQTFIRAVFAAEQTRQTSKASAFTTYGFVQANLAAYITALEAADNAYITAVNSAASTAGGVGITTPNAGPASQAPVVTLGNVGYFGPQQVTASLSATFGSVA